MIAPSPPAHPVLGHLRSFGGDPLGALCRWMVDHGDVLRLRLGRSTAHVLFHPDHVRWVLQENQRNYTKSTPGYATLKLFMGEGLLTSDGATWRRQRRIAQPAFHRDRMASFGAIIARAAEEMTERWRPWARAKKPFDVAAEMMRLTLRVVGEALFGVDMSAEADRVRTSIAVLQEEANRRITSFFDWPISWPTPKNRRLLDARGELHATIARIISARRRARGEHADLLTMLMETRDQETGETMSDAQLRDEAMTMFLAGHESTANALTWTFHLLSRNPAIGQRLRDEIAALGGRRPTFDDLPRLALCKAILQESMRLYPPAWSFGRAPTSDDVIGGYTLPAGGLVILAPWATHRHPAFWENPEGFDPDRFLADGGAGARARCAYFPFGAGPRACIGSGFAMAEALLTLATVASCYRLDLVPGHRVEPEPLITLRPRYGMRMTAHEVAP